MHDDSGDAYLRANSLNELLLWNDVDFVRCAYVTVLGRQPDPKGEADFTREIRSGTSKLDILWRLRKSVEGPLHDPGIAGFDRALRRAARQRRRIWGTVARLFGPDVDGNSRVDRALRALNNSASVNQRHLRSIDRKLAGIELSRLSTPQPAIFQSLAKIASVPQEKRKETLQLPELNHLQSEAPLARYFQKHAS